MYLQKGKIFVSQLLAWIMILFHAFWVFMGFVGIGMCISALGGNDKYFEPDEAGTYMAVYSLFVVIPGFIMFLGIRTLRLCGKANKFNSLFESDPDGELSAERTARLFNMPLSKLISLFDKLVKKGYLKNCSLRNPDNPVFVLNNGAETVEERYDIVHCPNCGAPNSVKYGFVEQCQYCGSKVIHIPNNKR